MKRSSSSKHFALPAQMPPELSAGFRGGWVVLQSRALDVDDWSCAPRQPRAYHGQSASSVPSRHSPVPARSSHSPSPAKSHTALPGVADQELAGTTMSERLLVMTRELPQISVDAGMLLPATVPEALAGERKEPPSATGLRRIRVGNYRIIFEVQKSELSFSCFASGIEKTSTARFDSSHVRLRPPSRELPSRATRAPFARPSCSR